MVSKCPKCGFKLKIDESKIPGTTAKVRCPKCKAKFIIKKKAEAAQPPPKREGLTCPKCGAACQPGDTECPECGIDVAYIERMKQEKRDKQKEMDKLPDWQKCPKCGVERQEGVKACPECGVNYKKYEAYLEKHRDEVDAHKNAHEQAKKAKIEAAKKKAALEAQRKKDKQIDSTLLNSLSLADKNFQKELKASSKYIEFASLDSGAVLPVIKGPSVDYTVVLDEEAFMAGEPIVRQDKHGSWIWGVLEGTVEIRKKTDTGLIPVIRVGTGSFIGSVAALSGQPDVRRSATVAAVESVELGVIDSQALLKEYNALSIEFRDLLLSLDKRLKQTTEKAVELYTKTAAPIKELIQGMKIFMKQGDNSGKLYAVKSGKALIVRKTTYGNVLLAELEPGDIIGDIPFLNIGQEPQSASIITSQDFQATDLDAAALKEEFDKISPTFKKLTDNTTVFILATTLMACEQQKKLKKAGK